MFETIAYWTGVVVWVLGIIYIAPLFPYIGLALCGRGVDEVLEYQESRFLPRHLSKHKRYRVIEELRERGERNEMIAYYIARMKRWVSKATTWYDETLLDPYYDLITVWR